MHVGVIGINYKSAELALREVLAKACEKCLGAESEIAARFSCVLLTTCNRTEVYFSSDDLALAHSTLLSVLREKVRRDFEPYLYSYFGSECFAHLAKVTAGLDSVVLAETEIQGQVKGAYQHAALHRHLGSSIHFLFQKSLKIGKHTRSSFPFTYPQVALEEMLFHITALTMGNSTSVLFVGYSEINRKVLSFFKKKGVEKIALCTRALKAAQKISKEKNISVFDWTHLPLWHQYDVVICGTSHSDYLVTPEQLTDMYDGQSRLLFDLSVPRTVDPRLACHPRISLFNIEQVGQLIEKKQKGQDDNMKQAVKDIQRAVHTQMTLFNDKQRPLFEYV